MGISIQLVIIEPQFFRSLNLNRRDKVNEHCGQYVLTEVTEEKMKSLSHNYL